MNLPEYHKKGFLAKESQEDAKYWITGITGEGEDNTLMAPGCLRRVKPFDSQEPSMGGALALLGCA